MSAPRLFRVAVQVTDIDAAVAAYRLLLGVEPERVGDGRYYFRCGATILACVDLAEEGHGEPRPNAGDAYFAVDDLDAYFDRAKQVGCEVLDGPRDRPWGERSFYVRDPFGNPLCFVDERTVYG